MKKIIALCISLLISMSTFSQKISETQIPLPVLNAFKTKFPSAKDVKWEKEDSAYSAEFLMDDAPTESEFDSLAKWKNTEWTVPVEYTPAVIKHYLDSAYLDCRIKELTILEIPTDNKSYVVEINIKKETMEVYFSITPCLFKKAVKKVPGKKKD